MMELFDPEWILRILCSLIIGAAIGYERHIRSREAGIRTHAIVAVTACVLMIISANAFEGSARNDPARIAAQVVSGVWKCLSLWLFTDRGVLLLPVY